MTNSPSDEQIKEWKEEFGRVFSTSISGKTYIFRALTYKEFMATEKVERVVDAEDQIINAGLLYPSVEELENTAAGVAVTIADEILDVSCFASPDRAKDTLDNHKRRAQDIWVTMKGVVIVAMPSYKSEELDQLTFDQLSELVALAERVVQINQELMGADADFSFEISGPEDEEPEQKPQPQRPQQPNQDPIAAKLHQAIQ